jgi:hypothetical protein
MTESSTLLIVKGGRIRRAFRRARLPTHKIARRTERKSLGREHAFRNLVDGYAAATVAQIGQQLGGVTPGEVAFLELFA